MQWLKSSGLVGILAFGLLTFGSTAQACEACYSYGCSYGNSGWEGCDTNIYVTVEGFTWDTCDLYGGGCSVFFVADATVSPDGTLLSQVSASTAPRRVASGLEEDVDCRGLVVARRYSPSVGVQLRDDTRVILV